MSQVDEPEVAWKAIEQNAQVLSSEGKAAGRVTRVVGDANADVFTGLAISLGPLAPERFVAAERVTGIWPDRVALSLTADEIAALPEHHEPGAGRWVPKSGILRRFFGR